MTLEHWPALCLCPSAACSAMVSAPFLRSLQLTQWQLATRQLQASLGLCCSEGCAHLLE